jgi:hypothetical protein
VIVHRDGHTLRLVTQPDHAAFAADALALFRLPALVGHPRRAALLRAVRHHDNGWRELDAAPPVDPDSGLPYDFRALPERLRLEVWERGAERYLEADPYVALLVHQHALALHAGRQAQPGWAHLLPRLGERRAELLARCELSEAALMVDYSLLDLADTLSLAACAGWSEPFERHGTRVAPTSGGLRLDPFPLAGATTFQVSCRRLPARRYTGDAALAATLAAERWTRFPVRLVPG